MLLVIKGNVRIQVFFTSNMQTVEEAGDFLPPGFDACDEGQRRPEEPVGLLGETQEHNSRMSVQVFY